MCKKQLGTNKCKIVMEYDMKKELKNSKCYKQYTERDGAIENIVILS